MCVALFDPVRIAFTGSDVGKRRYNVKLWKAFTDCFNCLPVAALVDEKIFCMHGGLSPDLVAMDQIRRILRPTGTQSSSAGVCIESEDEGGRYPGQWVVV